METEKEFSNCWLAQSDKKVIALQISEMDAYIR